MGHLDFRTRLISISIEIQLPLSAISIRQRQQGVYGISIELTRFKQPNRVGRNLRNTALLEKRSRSHRQPGRTSKNLHLSAIGFCNLTQPKLNILNQTGKFGQRTREIPGEGAKSVLTTTMSSPSGL